jgi:biopolymer transport protein ExbD
MSFIPEDEIKDRGGFNMAPMIDFLFLMLMFFASLAISRVTTKDTDIDLVEIKPETRATLSGMDSELKVINISINAKGEFKWVTEIRDYAMTTADEIANELKEQYQKGLLPSDKMQTQVLLRIDKNATWEPILKAIFAIRDAGFEVHPVYEPETSA